MRHSSGGGKYEVFRVWLLGNFRVSVGPLTIEEDRWQLRKAGSLVKLLALARAHRLHREQVMDVLWPDHDLRSQANNLYRTLHVARRILGNGRVGTAGRYLPLRGDVVSLYPDGPLWTDVQAFEEASAYASSCGEPAAYRAALDLYSGDLLPEDPYEDWTLARREDLRRKYLDVLVEMALIHEERADHASAVAALRRAVSEEPVNEEAHRALMRVYARSGRRQQALSQYKQLEKALERQLETEPDTTSRALHEEILTNRLVDLDPGPAGGAWEAPWRNAGNHNLPQAHSSFVGRQRELVEAKRALAMTRAMTFTGAGGCGKTRLALEVARDLAASYPDGVWLTELAPLSDPSLLPRAVAASLDVPEQVGRPSEEVLADYFENRNLLLVLDNCEHLVDAVARLADVLLAACPGLRILATSREPLGVSGEIVWTVQPLSLPSADEPHTIEGLMRCDAVRLFVDRARSRLPTFELTQENLGSTANVCLKLDGIPLAIELATARMEALAVEQVARRLDDSLRLLAGDARTTDPRQQTMRATLEWSHDLLSGEERELFARLSVFAGGWTLEAAEEVCSGRDLEQEDVLDLTSGLVDKSLVLAEGRTGQEARYRMLEPVRQYARERLEENGEGERVQEQHARYFLTMAEAAEPALVGPDQVAWLERLTKEHPNLRSALSWCLDEAGTESEERAEMGLRLAAPLGRFWSNLGTSEGREWLEKGLARSGAAAPSLRAKALNEAGWIAVFHFDPSAARLLEEALVLYKEAEDKTGQANSINHVMHAAGLLDNFGRVPTLHQEALALLEEPLEDPRAAAYLHLTLGMIAMFTQDHEQVVTRMEKALSLFKEAQDAWGAARCLSPMGIAALGRGDVDYAARANEEALELLRPLKDKIAIGTVLIQAAGVAVLRDRLARGACLFAAAQAVRRSVGHPDPVLKPLNYDYEALIATARAGLDNDAFEAAFSDGLAMSAEQAVEYALASDEPANLPTTSVRAPLSVSLDHLTGRQLEVALLASEGLTNRQIASELSISEHTVAAHLRKILKKLGLRSRAQISTTTE
jgi:predicted ATPase/DNA-binding SARP family transcriptional activator/DNA-binding CsgD family transcriptional regulator